MPSVSSMTFDGLTSRWTIPPGARARGRARSARDRHRLLEREATALQPRLQRLALVQRHGQEQMSFAGLADLENRADVGMIERRRRARLGQEARLGAPAGC